MMESVKPMYVAPGMTVENVEKKGSKAQQLAASLFDASGDGVLQKAEAQLFNNCDISLNEDKKQLTITQGAEQNKTTVTLTYNSEKDLKNFYINGTSFGKTEPVTKDCSLRIPLSESTQINYNIPEKNLAANRCDGRERLLYAKGLNEFTLSNSGLDAIYAQGTKSVKITNTADRGYFETSTKLEVDKNAELEIDSKSKINIQYPFVIKWNGFFSKSK